MVVYKLSKKGRETLYSEWLKLGGCAPPNWTRACKKLGAVRNWKRFNIKLGGIEEACPATGRMFAKFAAENMHEVSLVIPFYIVI